MMNDDDDIYENSSPVLLMLTCSRAQRICNVAEPARVLTH